MKVEKIVVHHTATSRDRTTFEAVNRYHRDIRKFPVSRLGFHVGYHVFIDGNGSSYKARKFTEIGSHVKGQNRGKVGIVLTGNFENEKPKKEQLRQLWKVIKEIRKEHPNIKISDIVGHQELAPSLCPGKNLMKKVDIWRKIHVIQNLLLKIKKRISLCW